MRMIATAFGTSAIKALGLKPQGQDPVDDAARANAWYFVDTGLGYGTEERFDDCDFGGYLARSEAVELVSTTTGNFFMLVLVPGTLTHNSVQAVIVKHNGVLLPGESWRKQTLSRAADGTVLVTNGWQE